MLRSDDDGGAGKGESVAGDGPGGLEALDFGVRLMMAEDVEEGLCLLWAQSGIGRHDAWEMTSW